MDRIGAILAIFHVFGNTPVERDKVKTSARGSAKKGIPAFKKKLEISSGPFPFEVLNLFIAVITCSDSIGVNKKVVLSG